MNAVDYKQDLIGWCSQNRDFQLGSDQPQSGALWSASVDVTGPNGGRVSVDVLQDTGDARVMVRSLASVPTSALGSSAEAAAEKLQQLVGQRPGWVRASTQWGGSETTVSLHTYIWPDGWSQHNCFAAIYEIAQSRQMFNSALGIASETPATAQTPASAAKETTASAGWSPVERPTTATPAASATAASVATPAAQAQAAFAPTHTVPQQGMQAWAAPDPAGPIVAHLAGGLPIQVAETRGAWARVICSNGWTGWVDGRIIGVTS